MKLQTVRHWTEQIFLVGLRRLPFLGTAAEIIQEVQTRFQLYRQAERLGAVEEELGRVEIRVRDLVQDELRLLIQTIRAPALSSAQLAGTLRDIRDLQEQTGYRLALFAGLLRDSGCWEELQQHPEHFGRLLRAGDKPDPNALHLFLDAEQTRLLEMPPRLFQALLLYGPNGLAVAQKAKGALGIEMRTALDIWALRAQAAARPVPKPATLLQKLGIALKPIPAGEFLMGSPVSEVGRQPDEGPTRLVRITQPFWLSATPITQAQYLAVMGRNPSYFQPQPPNEKHRLQAPVEQVTWFDAMTFCRRLQEQLAAADEPWQLRLPTEAEWEYACRAGTNTPFAVGQSLDGTQAACDGSRPYHSPTRTSRCLPTPVASFPANGWQLYDMHGNVGEWCADWYVRTAYENGEIIDPTGPGHGTARVVRGGSWQQPAVHCRSARRHHLPPQRAVNDVGFRIWANQQSDGENN